MTQTLAEYNANISTVQERILDVDGLIKQLVHEKGSFLRHFQAYPTR